MSKSFQSVNHPCLGRRGGGDNSLESTVPSGHIFTCEHGLSDLPLILFTLSYNASEYMNIATFFC